MKRGVLLVAVMVAGIGAIGCASHAHYGYVRMAPPAPRHEIIGYAPGPGYVWAAGYYAWRPQGGYYWVPGAWVRPPHRRTHWQRGRWERTPHGYQWHDGRWR